MKKKVLFLLPLFLGACSDSGESPVITIEKLYVKVDQGDGETIREDYANRMSEMPALKVGDKVDAFLVLDGNGAELKSFQLQNGEEGVTKTKVLVHATVEHVDKNGDVQLSFYLSSKAECEGAQEVIDLKTEVVENE